MTGASFGVRGVGKRFGERRALADVSFAVAPGEIVGILGPNGAGKTTLLAILSGALAADVGTLEGFGVDGRIGWVPQSPALYPQLTVAENLRFFGRLEQVPDLEATVDRMLAQADIRARAEEPVGQLSGGNRQRVNIAIGLLADPAVLLLDEPSAALDPRQRERLWEFVSGRAGEGTAVVFSTHDVAEVERFADRLLVLADGELLFTGTPAELARAADGPMTGLDAALLHLLDAHGH